MGLDIGCSCGATYISCSYSGFNTWRTELAKYVKIDLTKMNGFGKVAIPWTKKERFYYLLYHSDCDGHLNYRQCRKLLHDFDWLHQKLRNPTTKEFWHYLLQPVPEDWFLEYFDMWYDAVKHSVSNQCWLQFH